MADPLSDALDQLQRDEAAPLVQGAPKVAPAPTVPTTVTQPVSPVDDVLDQVKVEEDRLTELGAQQLQYRAANDKADPNKRAEVLRYSGATGMTPQLIEPNLDQVRERVKAANVDWKAVAYRQPGLVKMLQASPEAMPLVKDDAATLGGVEWALKAPFHAYWDAVNEQRTVFRQFVEATGAAGSGPDNQAAIRDLEQRYSKDYGDDGPVSTAAIATARMLPYLGLDVLSRATGGAIGAFAMGGEGAAAGAETGPGAAVPAAAGVVGGAAVGGFVGAGLFNYYEAVGPNYWKLINLKDANGEPLDPEVAQALAQTSAIITGGLMAGFLGKAGGFLTKPLIARFGAATIEKALVQPTVTGLLKRGGLEFGKHWLTGAALMGGVSAVNQASVNAAEDISGQPFDERGSVAAAGANGFIGGLKDMWLMSAIGPGRELIKDYGRYRASAESAARLEAMTESANASKLLERSPEYFQKAVEAMKAEKGAVKNAQVPIDDWTRYWQEKKLDPGQVAATVMGDGGKAYAEAVASKGDLSIPIEKFLAKLAKTEHGPALLMDTKLHPDELTPRQFQEERKANEQRMEAEAKRRAPELEQGKTEVRDFIREQAVKAGLGRDVAKQNAELVAEYVGTMAVRLGVSVPEAAALGNLGGLRILGPKGEAVAESATTHFQQFLRPTASRLLEQRLASMSPEARAREYYLDPVSGLRNERVFNAMPTPEGKQVAVITSPDIKGVNDHPTAGGHDVANEQLRAMGTAIGEGRPEAARAGTSFLVHVKDKAELAALVEKTRKALGNEHLNVVGELGANREAAFTALDKTTEQLRAEKQLPERGKLNPQLDVASLKFGPERAAGVVPEHLAQRVGSISDLEYANKAYVDTVRVGGKDVSTGLLTREGWEGIPRKANVASIDAKGLKAVNERFGKEAGNRLLFHLADFMAHFGGSSFDVAHLSGDEFAAQHDDPVQLERFVQRVKEALKGAELEERDPKTGRVESIPVDFRHGIGPDYGQADRALNTGKRAEAVPAGDQGQARDGIRGRPGDVAPEGQGAPRGEVPAGQVGEPGAANSAGREGDHGGLGTGLPDSAGGDRLGGVAVPPAESGPARGRGAARQGFGPQVVAHVEGVPVTYNAGAEKGPRGSISLKLDPTGRAREFAISAFAGDKSTLMHEVSHFLSWSFHDIAESDLATPQLKADYGSLLKWAGFASVKDRLFKAKEVEALQQKKERTPAEERRLRALSTSEERISHGFEQFLLEGKSPSAPLARVFSKFRGWLMNIYRGIGGLQAQYRATYGEDIGLSDDVRDIFQRLLAQDDALEQAGRDVGEGVTPATGAPPPLPTASMSPAEREAYRTALEAGRASAEQEVARRTAELVEGQVGETRAAIEREVAAELDRDPVNRAERFLQHGELVGADGVPMLEVPEGLLAKDGTTLKLDRKSFLAKFGKDEASLMPRGVFAEKGRDGVDVEQLAPLLGFNDGQALVDAFRGQEPRDQVLAKRTQDRVNATYGPALREVADAAMSAVHNVHTALATLLELRALAKLVDPATAARVNAIDPKQMRQAAGRLIEEKVVGDLDPDAFARAERRAAVKAAALWAKDKPASLEQRIGRLFNQMLYRAARDAKDSLERVQTKLEGTSEAIRANLGKADPVYRDAHDQVLAAVGIGRAPTEGAGVDAMVKRALADGHELDFDLAAIQELLAKPRDFEKLTVAEARNVADAVTNIRHIARESLEVELNGKRQLKAAFLKRFVDQVNSAQQPQPPMPYSRTAEGFAEKARRLRRGGQALLEDVETWAEMLDGGTSGPAHELLIDGRIACRTKENELNRKVLAIIKEKWADVPKEVKKLKSRLVDVGQLLPVKNDVLAPIFTRDTLWSLFLNWGSEGNRQRIRDGNGWSDDNVQKALELLTPGEAKFLQGVTESINSLFPELAAVHEKRTGLKLGKVDAEPVTIGDATYPGGYHPLKYDSRSSRQGELQEISSVKDLLGSAYQKPTLPSGHTKGRVEKVVAPVDLTWGTVPAHLAQVIRDISYGDWVRTAGGIMLSPEFKGATTKFLGEERAKEFIPWLRDVANARVDSAAGHQSDFMRRLGSFTRSRISLGVMGLNYASLARHMFDPWSMLADSEAVGPQHIAAAYLKVINPASWGHPDYALSKELANHEAALNDNLRSELAKIGPEEQGAFSRMVTTVCFAAHGLVHHFTARVMFRAAFDQASGAGATRDEAAQRGDDVVRRGLPSGDIADKPPILRTKTGWASAVMFYGYASKMHNLRARSFDAAVRTWSNPNSTPADKMTAIATVAGKWLAMGTVASLGSYFAFRGPKKDEAKTAGDYAEWLAEEVLLSPMDDVPIIGPSAKKVITGHKPNVASAPELALLNDFYERLGTATQKAMQSRNARDEEKVWMLVEALLGAAGPAGAVHKGVGYAHAVRKGEERPRGALDVAAGVLAGPGDRSANPLESIQGVLK